MSTGGWEIVGKKNKDKSNGKPAKLTKAEKQKFLVTAPKLEDFLPLNEVKSLYDSLDGNKENKKPSKEKESKTKENEERKKQQKLKQQQQQQAEKNKKQQQQKSKEKLPKAAEKAVPVVNVDEINELLENVKTKFPDAPLIWLKDLISYLDAKVPTEKDDPGFQLKPETYPLSLVSKAIRATLEKTIKLAGPQNAQLCWEGTLTTMVRNITNGTPDIGCKIFLQLLAQLNPEMTVANIPKLASLRNSYQNKKLIGLSLLWAFAQSGKKNLSVGLTIWHEIMAPMLESRSYAGYVIKILNDMLSTPKNVNNITTEQYLNIMDDLCSGKINIPVSFGNDVSACLQNLRLKIVKSELINQQKMFETLISRATPKSNAQYRDEIIKALVACITADVRCLQLWTTLHPKHLYQSDLLLKKFLADWDTLRSSVQEKALKEILVTFQTSNVVSKKGKEESLIESCERSSKALVEKMSAASKKDKSFPWKKGSLLLLVLIAGVVAFDCQKHGSFEASCTGNLLKKSKVSQYSHDGWTTVKGYTNQGLAYLEASSPEYYKATSNLLTKYFKLANELYLVSRNVAIKLYTNVVKYVGEKKPLVVDTLEHYFPGLLDNLHRRGVLGIEHVKTYSAVVGDHVVTQSTTFVRWLQKSVFVGNLSPDNLRGYATQAINTTQKFASQTYDWVYEKVQTLSKVQ